MNLPFSCPTCGKRFLNLLGVRKHKCPTHKETEMSIPTKVTVQLLGKGDVILFSVSPDPTMNVNFVMSDEMFLELASKLIVEAGKYPESKLRKLLVQGER